MRLYCEFGNCPCQYYGGRDDRCSQCGHGACWHANDHGQFESQRLPAETPQYMFVYVPQLPTVPPLPEASPRYCPEVIGLPV